MKYGIFETTAIVTSACIDSSIEKLTSSTKVRSTLLLKLTCFYFRRAAVEFKSVYVA